MEKVKCVNCNCLFECSILWNRKTRKIRCLDCVRLKVTSDDDMNEINILSCNFNDFEKWVYFRKRNDKIGKLLLITLGEKINFDSMILIAKLLKNGMMMYRMVKEYRMDPRIFYYPSDKTKWEPKEYE